MNFDSLRDNDATRSIEYEQTVIGAILLNPNAVADAMEIVKTEYFSEENHKNPAQIQMNRILLHQIFIILPKISPYTISSTARIQSGTKHF
mgnify:CR=1 FL=1